MGLLGVYDDYCIFVQTKEKKHFFEPKGDDEFLTALQNIPDSLNLNKELTPHHSKLTLPAIAVGRGLIKSVSYLCEANKIDINWRDKEKLTLLHVAALKGDLKMCEKLIQSGAQLDLIDQYGETPLFRMLGSEKITLNQKMELAQVLSDLKSINIANEDGISPLMFAVFHQSVPLFEVFLERGAEINKKVIDFIFLALKALTASDPGFMFIDLSNPQTRTLLTLLNIAKSHTTCANQIRFAQLKRDIAIPEDYLCPITSMIMTEPAYDRNNQTAGHFERSALVRWLERSGTHPTTRAPISRDDVVINTTLKDDIDAFLTEAEQLARPRPNGP